jgi:hypothetical protein
VICVTVLEKFLNPIYLQQSYIQDLQETLKAKPISKYLVLDHFLKEELLDQIIADHKKLEFDEKRDRTGADGSWLPYDGALAGCDPNTLLGELLYSPEWQEYCLKLTGLEPFQRRTEIKLRSHQEEATGFWIHSDAHGGGGGARNLVSILYFNKNWKNEDGGLLQLWRKDEVDDPETLQIGHKDTVGRLDFLNNTRLNVRPAGFWPYGGPHDLVLVDQIVPTYNRLFICNFKAEPAYHSVTPSNGKIRTGFVQWLLED